MPGDPATPPRPVERPPSAPNRAPLGSVFVRISRCVDLLREGAFPVLDPFVKVSYGAASAPTRVLRAQTPSTAKSGTRPRTAPSPAAVGPTQHVWDEDLPLFSISVEDLAAARDLLVEVYDYEVMKGDRLVGSASVSLADVRAAQLEARERIAARAAAEAARKQALEADPGLALQQPPPGPPKPPELPDRPVELRLPLRGAEQRAVGELHVAVRVNPADSELDELLEGLRRGVPPRLIENHELAEAQPPPRSAFSAQPAGDEGWLQAEWWAEQGQPAGAAQVLVRANAVAPLGIPQPIEGLVAEVTIGPQRLRLPVGPDAADPPLLTVPFVAEDPDAVLAVDLCTEAGELVGRAEVRLADTGVPLDGQFHGLSLELETSPEAPVPPGPLIVSLELAMLPIAGAAEVGKLRGLWAEMEARTAGGPGAGPRFISLDSRPPVVVDATGQAPGSVRTLREALAAAGPGQRVAVLPGRYQGSVHVFRSVQIEGAGESRDDVVLSATDESVIVSSARGASLRNVTIAQMGGTAIPAVGVMAGDIVIENCDVSCRGHACISVHSGADPTIAGCSIHDSLTGPGIWFHDEGTRGRVEACDIFRCHGAGVSVEDGAGPLLVRNAVHDCGGAGVAVHAGGRGALVENDLYRNGPCELLLRGAGTDPLVRHNTLRLARRAALVAEQGAKGQVVENDVLMSEGNGVSVTTGANPLLTSNRVLKCAHIGIHVHSGGRGCFAVNEVSDCREFALVVAPQCRPVMRANALRGRTSVPV